MYAKKKTKAAILPQPTTPRRGISKTAAKLFARTESVKTFAGAQKILWENVAALLNGRITTREANIINRAANSMMERLKKRFGI